MNVNNNKAKTWKEMIGPKIWDQLLNFKSPPIGIYVKDFACPTCGYLPYHVRERNCIGWCETPQGLQMIYECPHCFTLYRYHNSTTGRFNLDTFMGNLYTELVLQNKIDRNDKK